MSIEQFSVEHLKGKDYYKSSLYKLLFIQNKNGEERRTSSAPGRTLQSCSHCSAEWEHREGLRTNSLKTTTTLQCQQQQQQQQQQQRILEGFTLRWGNRDPWKEEICRRRARTQPEPTESHLGAERRPPEYKIYYNKIIIIITLYLYSTFHTRIAAQSASQQKI